MSGFVVLSVATVAISVLGDLAEVCLNVNQASKTVVN